ncbi:MAG: TIGR01777 family oxidoreductase [Bacteroidota bacterium]
MSQKVLITGASGLIGQQLTDLLLQKRYQVIHLGRRARQHPVTCFAWDVKKGSFDLNALDGVTSIIHLAGAGIADERWTPERKKEILESRTLSTRLLFDTLNTSRHQVKNVIAASAIGYYGFEDNSRIFTEDDSAGNDFLAGVVKAWEREIDQIAKLAIRVAKVRIGIVLSNEGGALTEMARPVRWFVGSPLASGKQMLSWIHIDDLCQMFLFLLENENHAGAFNAVAPEPEDNATFTKKIAAALNRPMFLPNVPAFVLKMIVGEMADLVINGSTVSCAKIQSAGFQFKFPSLQPALNDLLRAN